MWHLLAQTATKYMHQKKFHSRHEAELQRNVYDTNDGSDSSTEDRCLNTDVLSCLDPVKFSYK